MAEAPAQLLATKPHFDLLDGLRGVAAVAVVVFHFMEIAVPDYENDFIAHGYLAVDFFFCLSGFVIAYAYDSRIKAIGLAEFFKTRLIRLQPLVVIGAVLGLVCFLFDPFSNLAASYSAVQKAAMLASACLLIPYPVVAQRYANLFHLNPPTWSLFWEYIATIFYALVLFRLRNKRLALVVVGAAVLLIYEAHYATNLVVGWSGGTFWGGGVRVLFSFSAGMLVYRANWIIKSRLGFISLGGLLLLAFLVPYSTEINWLTDPLLVILYFPLLVALGAGVRPAAPLAAACRCAGEISYPLYMVHYPFLWLFLSYVERDKPGLNQLAILIPLAAGLLIVLAYLTLVVVDAPIRARLKTRFKKSVSTS